MDALEQGFRFEELRVDPSTGEVAGPGGREKLDRKVMDVFVLMARHAGHVVSRDELLEQLWPDVVVTDDALTRCFYELRRQLTRAGGDGRYRTLIETLPKRGYRLSGLVAPIEPQPDVGTPDVRRRRVPAAAIGSIGVAVLAVAGIALYLARSPVDVTVAPDAAMRPDSIAVLPFVDMSAHRDQGYFADGVAEEILNRLSQSTELRVIARTSSFSIRDESLDVPQIAAKLEVNYVLEGSIRKSEDRIRITAQLIDVATNAHVWSETFDRGIGDVFAIQDEIASSVATALQVALAGGELHRGMPTNVEAYERYLHGRHLYTRRGPGDIERAVQYYEEAVGLDPDYARAWAALSGAYALLTHLGRIPSERGRPLQRDAALRATSLDPKLAVAQSRLARYYFDVGNPEKGREHSRLAFELDPHDPLVLGRLAGVATWQSDFEKALAIQRRLVARDPLSTLERLNLAGYLMATARFDAAIAELRIARELNPEIAPEIDRQIAQLHVLQGRVREADAIVNRIPAGHDRDRAMALLHQIPARGKDANEALMRLISVSEKEPSAAVAEIYAFRGMHDRAIEALQSAHKTLKADPRLPEEMAFRFQLDLRTSPFLKPLHGDPRWPELKDRHRARKFDSQETADSGGEASH